jgi:hypothetical protein
VLDLSGDAGKQIVRSETKLALRTHSKTFERVTEINTFILESEPGMKGAVVIMI